GRERERSGFYVSTSPLVQDLAGVKVRLGGRLGLERRLGRRLGLKRRLKGRHFLAAKRSKVRESHILSSHLHDKQIQRVSQRADRAGQRAQANASISQQNYEPLKANGPISQAD